MLSHSYELLQLSLSLHVDIVRCKPSVPWIYAETLLRDARTVAPAFREKRHGRGGDVFTGYAANMHGNYVRNAIVVYECVITTLLLTPYGTRAIQLLALLYAPLLLACAPDCSFETHNLQQDVGYKGTVRETERPRHHCAAHVYSCCSCHQNAVVHLRCMHRRAKLQST